MTRVTRMLVLLGLIAPACSKDAPQPTMTASRAPPIAQSVGATVMTQPAPVASSAAAGMPAPITPSAAAGAGASVVPGNVATTPVMPAAAPAPQSNAPAPSTAKMAGTIAEDCRGFSFDN